LNLLGSLAGIWLHKNGRMGPVATLLVFGCTKMDAWDRLAIRTLIKEKVDKKGLY
jgi:hypothetical protein